MFRRQNAKDFGKVTLCYSAMKNHYVSHVINLGNTLHQAWWCRSIVLGTQQIELLVSQDQDQPWIQRKFKASLNKLVRPCQTPSSDIQVSHQHVCLHAQGPTFNTHIQKRKKKYGDLKELAIQFNRIVQKKATLQ